MNNKKIKLIIYVVNKNEFYFLYNNMMLFFLYQYTLFYLSVKHIIQLL